MIDLLMKQIMKNHLDLSRKIKKTIRIDVEEWKVNNLLKSYKDLVKSLRLEKMDRVEILNMGRILGQMEILLYFLKKRKSLVEWSK